VIRSIVFALGFAVSSGAALGHAQAQPAWAFEVASIKPNQATDARGYMRVMPGGRFEAVNATAMLLLTFARTSVGSLR